MLFNSYEFIIAFLVPTVLLFYALVNSRFSDWRYAMLALASLVFYAAWSVRFATLLCASVALNYAFGRLIETYRDAGRSRMAAAVALGGIVLNVGALCYFKYTNFLIVTFNGVTGQHLQTFDIILPLGISFYTFQKIAFLVDAFRGDVRLRGFTRYALFVLFFPPLIAGPIVHFRELAPQFACRRMGRHAYANLSIGLTLFAIGLFKKAVIADTAALFASPTFGAAEHGLQPIGFWLAWQAALSYTIELYFDFSGYTDMAIGLARLFGIKLPMNFQSPLQAGNIVDFWRRWHMTLQRFLVTYVFQPIALPLTRYAVGAGLGRWSSFAIGQVLPTMLVFLLSGLWHGAGWTFVLWGLLHGVYVSVAETWRHLFRRRRRPRGAAAARLTLLASGSATVVAVVVSNVLFRAESLHGAWTIYRGMARVSDVFGIEAHDVTSAAAPGLLIGAGFALILFCPNIYQVVRRYDPALDWKAWRALPNPIPALIWRPDPTYATVTGLVFAAGALFVMRGQSTFIYFNF